MSALNWVLCNEDRDILLDLATRVRKIADSPRNQEIKRQWYLHDECKAERPLLLTETDGGLKMVLPDFKPRCREQWAQRQEWMFTDTLCHAEVIGDDTPVEPWVRQPWQIQISDYGIPFDQTKPSEQAMRGAYHINPILDDLDKDLDKLKPRTYSVDRESSLAAKAFLEELYGGILGVRMRGNPFWTQGLTIVAINFVGLEGLMLKMYDQPEGLHRLMGFLRDQNLSLLRWLEQEKVLNLNNENDYIGSGSRGYTRALPQPDAPAGGAPRVRDIWVLLESQETVSVGPEQYEEFVFRYENTIAREAGRVYYGCCEPVHTRWHVLKNMANLKRISISPWCDQEFMADQMRNKYGFSRKPNPSLISTEIFDENAIRADLRKTMEITKAHGCSLEIAMKDVHTLCGEPDRLTRWVKLARQVSGEVYK